MTASLFKNIDKPKSKNLVFSSAGNHANLDHWLEGERNFDLWICYYGDDRNKYKQRSDYYIERKGGKFPNLHYSYQRWKDIFANYCAIFIIDDDIIIKGNEISRLFEIRDQYDLWVIQPTFSPLGKISHPITTTTPFSLLRYTNFVEVGCPLFRRDKLDFFIRIYDPILVGWGIDYWFIDALGSGIKGRVAVIDEISCINPYDNAKGGQREIDLLQDTPTRIRNWERIKIKYSIKVQERMEFGNIKSPMSFSTIYRAIKIYSIIGVTNCLKKLKILINHLT